jgi:NAD(P)-dependent dehydrogenase (short-subunit alcohol dehydrogenase family)
MQRINANAAGVAAGGTPVPKNSILVVGGTGTLGRQVVRKALDEGYEVRCIVKPRMNPADFLRDWGATTVQVGAQQQLSKQVNKLQLACWVVVGGGGGEMRSAEPSALCAGRL